MNNKKFNSKEELDNYLLSNKTPFSVIDQKIDYSLVSKKKRKVGFSLKNKLTAAIASVLLVVSLCIGGYFINNINNKSNCPFELGTYTYASQEGSIEGLDFSESSYIVLTDEKLTGPGTFVIEDEENDWVVYGKFYCCNFEGITIGKMIKDLNYYYVNVENYKISIIYSSYGEDAFLNVDIINNLYQTEKIDFINK